MKSFTLIALLSTAFASEGLGGHLSHLFLKDTNEVKSVLPKGDSVVGSVANKYASEDDVAQLDKYISKLTVADLSVKEPRMVVNKPADEMINRLSKAKKHQASADPEMIVNVASTAAAPKARGAVARSNVDTLKEAPRFIPAAPAHAVVVSSLDSLAGKSNPEMDSANLVLSAFQKAPKVLAPVLPEESSARGLPVESRGLPVESVESRGVKEETVEKKLPKGDSVVSSKHNSSALRGSAVEERMVEALEKYVSAHANEKKDSKSPVMIVNVD